MTPDEYPRMLSSETQSHNHFYRTAKSRGYVDRRKMDGGYNFEFVDTPMDMLICKICYHPSREPYLSACCGHTFCKSCLNGYEISEDISIKHPLTKGGSGGCPLCHSKEFKCVHNKQTERAIKSLKVFCANKKEGCTWEGEISSIDTHLAQDCLYEMVDCPNDCGKTCQQQHLVSHVENKCIRRKASCPLCHSSGEHNFINDQHKKYCPKFPLMCPNECGTSMLREDVDEHRKTCLLEKVNCPNNCGMSSQRQCMDEHVASECPQRIVNCQHCHTSGEHKFIEERHKDHCHKFPMRCPNNCEVETIPREKMQSHLNTVCSLEIVQCDYHVVGCEARVARKDLEKHKKEGMENHLSMTAHQITSTHATLNKTVAEFCTRINEIETTTHKRVDKLKNKMHSDSTVLETFVGRWAFKINSEAMNQSIRVVPLIVRMLEVTDQELWTTDPFLTHTEGYKLTLSLTSVKATFLQSSYLSLCVNLMEGPHDNKLPWPMNGMLKVMLLNQNRDDEHPPPVMVSYLHSKPVAHGEMKQAGFIKRFISHEKLHEVTERRQFLKFNGILFHVDTDQQLSEYSYNHFL